MDVARGDGCSARRWMWCGQMDAEREDGCSARRWMWGDGCGVGSWTEMDVARGDGCVVGVAGRRWM
jgi:hypothetical protein